jgi:AraC-like DNA-binding protein
MIAAVMGYALSRGVAMEQITAATGLHWEDVADPEGWLPEALMPAVWCLVAAVCPDEPVGLMMSMQTPFTLFGPLAYACRHAENMRSGLRAFVRYQFTLSDNLHVALTERSGEARLSFSHPMDAKDGGHAAELGLGLGVRFAREMQPDGSRHLRVEFGHGPHGSRRRYEDLLGTPVLFEQGETSFVFRADALDRPMKDAEPNLFRFVQSHMDQTRERLAALGENRELTRIRGAIAQNAERSEYGADALARRLGTSLRALQRLTCAHDTTLQALLEEAREMNARRLLSDGRLSIEEVAFLLGYSEDRAFRRAFKRWTGQTPAQVRRAGQ